MSVDKVPTVLASIVLLVMLVLLLACVVFCCLQICRYTFKYMYDLKGSGHVMNDKLITHVFYEDGAQKLFKVSSVIQI